MTESINKGDIFHNIADISKYEILHHANVDCNLAHQIVYRSLDTGRVYSRPESEFQEKFYKSSVSAMMDNIENICDNAQSVVKKWDTMVECISELRIALQKLKETNDPTRN